MADGFSRDPATKARLNLPEDLANLDMDPPAVDEEEEWPQYEQNIFEDDETEMHPYDEADDAMFDIGYMARSIRAGDPAHAVMVYHTTKHHVTDFDPVMITKLWELGMHVEAKDLYERTLQFVGDDYSQTSIVELWEGGMEEQAWQLHILKARWFPKVYPADEIIDDLTQNMHRFAVSLHDRTISLLYDKADGVSFVMEEIVECIVTMSASGMKNQAHELYELTLKLDDEFHWHTILELKECGMASEAAELLELTAPMAKVYDAMGIINLHEAGFKQQAEELHKRTVDKVTEYDWSRILNLDELGMRQAAIELHEHALKHAHYDEYGIIAMYNVGLDTQAQELHNATVRDVKVYDVMSILALHGAKLDKQASEYHVNALPHANFFAVPDIVDLNGAGMETQAGELFTQTIGNAKKYDVNALIALLVHRMAKEADEYFKTTAPMITSYELEGILELAHRGYKEYASKMNSASCQFAHVDCDDPEEAKRIMRKLRDIGLPKGANKIQEMLDACSKKRKNV
jgi:tetratricopeptide (TPR) repeat protein